MGNPYSGSQSVGQWFNTDAFAQPSTYTFGNEGVGILRGPGLINMDVSILRDFHPTEKFRLQVRGEFRAVPGALGIGAHDCRDALPAGFRLGRAGCAPVAAP